jgi:serine/threonine protein kinase
MDDWLPVGFNVLERLGSGSFGRVELVQRDADDRLFALKVLTGRGMKSADPEIEALRQIDSPFVAQVYDVFRQETYVSFLLDPSLGGSLRQKIAIHKEAKAPFDTAEILNILTQILLALSAVHAAGIVHRDLGPSNLLFVEQDPPGFGRLQVIDFGVAGLLSSGVLSGSHGTPLYMSPEVSNGDPHNCKADMYSLGVIIHEMSELALPAGPGNVKLTGYPPLSEFVSKLLSANPAERPTAAQCLRVKRIAAVAAEFGEVKRLELNSQDYQPVVYDFSAITAEPVNPLSASGKPLTGTQKMLFELKEQERVAKMKARANLNELAQREIEYKQRIEKAMKQRSEKMAAFRASRTLQPQGPVITPEQKAVDDLETTRIALEKAFDIDKLVRVHRMMEENPALSPSELRISPLQYDQISRLLRREREVYG